MVDVTNYSYVSKGFTRCPFEPAQKILTSKDTRLVAVPKNENSMIQLFESFLIRKNNYFEHIRKIFPTADENQVFAFVLHGYEAESVVDSIRIELASVKKYSALHYRVTALPVDMEMFCEMEKPTFYYENDRANVMATGIPFHRCLVELSKSVYFKLTSQLENKYVNCVVAEDYNNFYKLFNFYLINKHIQK